MEKINENKLLVDRIHKYIDVPCDLNNAYQIISIIDRLKFTKNFKDDELILDLTKAVYNKINLEVLTDKLMNFAETFDPYEYMDNLSDESRIQILEDLKKGSYKSYVKTVEECAVEMVTEISKISEISDKKEYYELIDNVEICTSILKDFNLLRRLDFDYEKTYSREIKEFDYNEIAEYTGIEKREDNLYYKYIDIPIPDMPLSEVLDENTILIDEGHIRSYYREPVEMDDAKYKEMTSTNNKKNHKNGGGAR